MDSPLTKENSSKILRDLIDEKMHSGCICARESGSGLSMVIWRAYVAAVLDDLNTDITRNVDPKSLAKSASS